MCKPKTKGGLGFRRLQEFSVAMLGKQAWIFLKFPLVSKVYKARYFPKTLFVKAGMSSNPSFIWRSIIEVFREGCR